MSFQNHNIYNIWTVIYMSDKISTSYCMKYITGQQDHVNLIHTTYMQLFNTCKSSLYM